MKYLDLSYITFKKVKYISTLRYRTAMADVDIKHGQLTGDKSARSVFVGNIPYEATEEKLKEIFSEVGTVLSFKLVYDRENG